MHDWTEERDREILRKCFNTLPSGVAIVISELLVNVRRRGRLQRRS